MNGAGVVEHRDVGSDEGIEYTKWLVFYWLLVLIIYVPRPPAPEGWDKDITQRQHTHTNLLNTTKVPDTLLVHHHSNTCSGSTITLMSPP